MTNDTKKALDIIEPMAKELGIDVTADNKFLYCNGQAIGIGCNSTFATIMEFIGYVMVKVYERGFRFSDPIPAKYRKEIIQRYWYSKAQIEKFQSMEDGDE